MSKKPLHAPADPKDDELFLRAMSGVKKLPSTPERIEPEKTLESRRISEDDLAHLEFQSFARGEAAFSMDDSPAFQSGLAPGVTDELLASLRDGAYSFSRRLDLHGYRHDEAKLALSRFINNAYRDAERCVLVITGRGRGSPLGVSVLREAVPEWLSHKPLRACVLAFCTARSHDGGPGALYVLLRRPERSNS